MLATQKLRPFGRPVESHVAKVEPGQVLVGGPYDVVVASLALRDIVGLQNGEEGLEEQYARLFGGIFESLKRGGHLVVGDHVALLPLFQHLKIMERVGFVDVDCRCVF